MWNDHIMMMYYLYKFLKGKLTAFELNPHKPDSSFPDDWKCDGREIKKTCKDSS